MIAAAERAGRYARYLAEQPVKHARTGQTPHEIIFRQNKAVVRYYAPKGTAVLAPIFVVMPLINNWRIWDLLPDRSVVAALQAAGAPVYLLDWGVPGPEDAEVTVSDLIDGLLHRGIDRARRHARQQPWAAAFDGAPPLDAAGYCVGGTFLAIYLARHPELVRRAAFVATPIDFYKAGRLGEWVRPEQLPLDQLVDGFGNYPGELIKGGFVTLRPINEVAKYVGLWERIDDPGFRELWAAMEQWAADTIDFPGEAYREYVRACYFENRLVEGGWRLAGRELRLGEGRAPALVVAATKDHIVPPDSAFALDGRWGGPVRRQLVDGGHVGMSVGRSLPAALVAWARESAG